jgi:hypothetical protein
MEKAMTEADNVIDLAQQRRIRGLGPVKEPPVKKPPRRTEAKPRPKTVVAAPRYDYAVAKLC